MFAYFYQLCIVIFLLQGISLPFLIILSGILWRRQSQRLAHLKQELDISDGKIKKSRDIHKLILEGLPKLKPLNCNNCGAGVLLQETDTFCPHCHNRGGLPDDYAATVKLKARVRKLVKSALNHWRVANVLTFPVVRWLFFLSIFIEPFVLFPTALIGANLFTDTWIDRAFIAMGETMSFLIVLSAFFGFVIWMIIFIMLTNLSKTLREQLPVVPVFEGELRGSEVATCEACGGGIKYDKGDFACICSYCNVENYRVRFARRERMKAETQKTQTTFVFFGAMGILEDFVGMFFFLSVLLVGSAFVLAIVYAVKDLL